MPRRAQCITGTQFKFVKIIPAFYVLLRLPVSVALLGRCGRQTHALLWMSGPDKELEEILVKKHKWVISQFCVSSELFTTMLSSALSCWQLLWCHIWARKVDLVSLRSPCQSWVHQPQALFCGAYSSIIMKSCFIMMWSVSSCQRRGRRYSPGSVFCESLSSLPGTLHSSHVLKRQHV